MNAQTKAEWFDPEATTFGDRIAGARELAGMTQADLARRIGVRDTTLENWENDHSEPRANRLSMLAGLLNVSILWLLTGEGEGPVFADKDNSSSTLADALDEIRTLSGTMTACAERITRLERCIEVALADA